jgi:hypothetical protein
MTRPKERATRCRSTDWTRGRAFPDLDALLGSRAAPVFLVLRKTETAGHLQILDCLLTAAGKETRVSKHIRERSLLAYSGQSYASSLS